MIARAERDPSGPHLWQVVTLTADGSVDRVVVREESYGVALALALALNHPEAWWPSEAYEVADACR